MKLILFIQKDQYQQKYRLNSYTKMNIMNYTQPNFYSVVLQNAKNASNTSINNTKIHLEYVNQIHKTPQNIRKSIRQKHSNFKNFVSQQKRYQMDQQTPVKEQGATQDKKIFLINARKIKNYNSARKEQNSFDDFVRIEKQHSKSFMHEIRKKLIKQSQRNHINKSPARNSFQQRIRRLSPLKRGSLIIQKKTPKKQLQITFLNIEKAPLTKMYQNVGKQEQEQNKQKQQKEQVFNKTWNPQQIQTNFNKSSIDKYDNNSPSNKLSMTMNGQFSPKRKTFSQSFGVNLVRSKKFVPPFERYYYRDFLWKVSYSNGLLFECPKQYEKKFKVFIGKGNNSLLIKSLMKRRFSWWTITEKYDEANFIWTQIKINQIFKNQQSYQQPILSLKNHQVQKMQGKFENSKKNQFNAFNKKILNDQKLQKYQEYLSKHLKVEQKLDGTMRKRNKIFKKIEGLLQINCSLQTTKIHNHLPNNYIIGNKKALYYTMTTYYQKMGQDPFKYLPETYHIQNGLEDQQYSKFLKRFYQQKKLTQKQERQNSPKKQRMRNMWIVKPGEFSNRGNGITVCLTLQEIKALIKRKQRHDNGNLKTFILQSYIDKPFLYQRRKFDIRHYMMITSINGKIKGYWYELGYIRTTSYEYSTKNSLSSIHLTNDAVQKNLPDYGKYQKGNKLTYLQFQSYLDRQYSGRYNFFDQIYPKMKQIATDAIRASSLVIDPTRKINNFQVFGLDFMIDQNFSPWLIQINNNPCLQLSCPHLAEIIPAMVENAIKICIDSLVPPPATFEQKRPNFSQNILESNKFQLVYDSDIDELQIRRVLNGQKITQKMKQLQNQQDQVFQDDGKQLQD